MKTLTLEQQRTRIRNINRSEEGNIRCFRRHRIREYLPGQAVYNLGDYPARFSIEPTEYDYTMLKDMAANGVELIQIHEEWNDPIRHLGADKYSTFDPEGLQHFVDLCHYFGIRIIPYISSGYFHQYDPDFREEFAQTEKWCTGMHFHYRRCSAGSAEWRQYVLPRTFAVLDRYGFDGIYNDWGLDSSYVKNGRLKRPGVEEYDPEIEDFLGILYQEVKRRGGIYKLHAGRLNCPPCLDRVYDYLWIGEAVGKAEIGVGKSFPDYVVPCQDKRFLVTEDPDFYFAAVIPFLQFPLLTARGRPLMGKRIEEDVTYYGINKTEYNFNKQIGEYMKEHPNGPYVYSLWSSIPDDVTEYPRWCRYLALYRPMVEENSVAYVELRECADILSPIPDDVYISMFVNENRYLAVSNLTASAYDLKLRGTWRDRELGTVSESFRVQPGKILFLCEEE